MDIPKKPDASDFTAEEYHKNKGSTFLRNFGYFTIARF
jgi:hypothetical protein